MMHTLNHILRLREGRMPADMVERLKIEDASRPAITAMMTVTMP